MEQHNTVALQTTVQYLAYCLRSRGLPAQPWLAVQSSCSRLQFWPAGEIPGEVEVPRS